MKQKIIFVTGNSNKFKEVNNLLNTNQLNYDFGYENIDLPEIQGTIDEIVKDKCLKAYNSLKEQNKLNNVKAILTEDVSLEFNALNGLPGVYIKWFLKKIDCQGLFDIIKYKSKDAMAICSACLIILDDNQNIINVVVHNGCLNGTIVEPNPKHIDSFGWDPIFVPYGHNFTFADMNLEYKNKISHRFLAMQMIKTEIENF